MSVQLEANHAETFPMSSSNSFIVLLLFAIN